MALKLKPEQLKDLFFHRDDVFAQQLDKGMYFPVKRPITIKDIKQHLKGEITLGAYCLRQDNTVRWCCVDIDIHGEVNSKSLWEVKKEAIKIYLLFNDLPRIIEYSGRRGYHVWILFKKPTNALYAQRLVKARLNREGLNKHEVFPKQTELNEGRKYGNLVKIPMAKHRVSGRFSQILQMEGI